MCWPHWCIKFTPQGNKMKKRKYALGGNVTPMEDNDKYKSSSLNKFSQGMMSAKGQGASMGLNEGGYINCGASMKPTQKNTPKSS